MNKDTKKVYEKPIMEKEKTMKFPVEIINKLAGKRIVCMQCSNCHGCR